MNYGDVISILAKDAGSRAAYGGVLVIKTSDIDPHTADNVQMYYAEIDAIKTLEYLRKQGIENPAALAEEMEHFNRLKNNEEKTI